MSSFSTEHAREAEERQRNAERRLAWRLRWAERFPQLDGISIPPAMNWRWHRDGGLVGAMR